MEICQNQEKREIIFQDVVIVGLLTETKPGGRKHQHYQQHLLLA